VNARRAGSSGPPVPAHAATAEPADRLQVHVDAGRARGVLAGQHGQQTNVFGDYYAGYEPVSWPVLVGRPPLRADAFQERAGLREAIERALAAREAAVVTQVVAGDGGTGKTQLAAAEFERARRAGVDLAVWVSATSRASMLASYAQARVSTCTDVRLEEGVEARAAAFIEWLAMTERSWIMVLDDVADPAELAGLWPVGSSGRVVVTTRRRDAALSARGRLVNVGVFTPEESTAYLEAKLGQAAAMPATAMDGGQALAADLGYLPLALAQAAAVIVDDAISCATYRAHLADTTRALTELFPAATADEYERTVASTWSLAADRADALPPVGLARPVLALTAVMDPNGVPESVLSSYAARVYVATALSSDSLLTDQTDGVQRREAVSLGEARSALRNLHRLSLVSHDPTDGLRGVRMHALAQRVSQEYLARSRLAETVRAAADALLEVWPEVEAEAALGKVLRANTDALAGRLPTALWEPNVHPAVFRAGNSLGEAGLVAQAAKYFAEVADTASRVLGPSHPDTLTARGHRATWRGQAGDAAGAVQAFGRLLSDRLRVLGPDHPDTLTTRHHLARWRGEAGEAAGAANASRDLLVDRMRVLGPDHPDTLTTRSEVAHWLGEAGDFPAAAAAFEQLLSDVLRILGPDHLDTLTTRNNLAYWRGRAGDAVGAVADAERLLADRMRVLGRDHPDTLRTRSNLARWRGHAGDPPGAVAALEELYVDQARLLGTDHPDTLVTRNNLGRWRGQAGDPSGAVVVYEELLTDVVRVLGRHHPDTLTTRHNLAYWRGQAGDPPGAAKAFEQLLTDVVRVLGPTHPDTLAARENLAYWRGQAGDADGAATAYELLLTDVVRVLGPTHPDSLTARENLLYWRGQANRYMR
jgi:hypothetical protein